MTTHTTDLKTDPQRTLLVPVSKLLVHDANVRRTGRRMDIEALAASIAAHGLLQTLAVVRTEDGRYAVVAGARRLAALKLLIKTGRIARDAAAPCTLVDASIGTEASLAENVHRVAMNAMDEMEAFARLVDEGLSADAIAERFGATVRHVEQRLALGRLSPRIRGAYRRGELTLDVARAFCLTDDHGAQERLFRQLPRPITHAASVRNALSGGRTSVTDRMARFVGVEAYEAAGGRVVRDLFEDDVAYLDDGALLQQLASARLDRLREDVQSEGWGWVEAHLHHAQIEGCANERLRPRTRPPERLEADAIAALQSEIEKLDAELESKPHDDALWAARDTAQAHLEALTASLQSWASAEMACAGASVGIDWDGKPVIARGLIRRKDLKEIRRLQALDTPQNGDEASDAAPADDATPVLPKALVTRLTAARTRAIRAELAGEPHAALALVVLMLIRRSAARRAVAGLSITSTPVGFDDDDRFERARTEAAAVYGDFDIVRLADEGSDKLMDLLALFVAEAIDVTHDGASPGAAATQATADALASLLELDMRRHWEASMEFWAQAPKSFTVAALDQSLDGASLCDTARRTRSSAWMKMKRTDLAQVAQRELRDWLPDLLITPARRGGFDVTPSGTAAVGLADPAA